MATTTQITNIAHKIDLTDYAGDFIDDYDMDAVRADYIDRLDSDLPEGVDLLRNGDVIATLDAADAAREFNFDEFIDYHDPSDLFERHDHTAKLLPAVAETRAAIERAEREHITAVRLAKNAKRFTGDQIAEAAGITRDGVYKMLARSRPTVTFHDPDTASFLAEMPQLVANGHRVDVDGLTVTLTADALDVLAELGDDEDGHYDGVHIWIGGSEYRVEG